MPSKGAFSPISYDLVLAIWLHSLTEDFRFQGAKNLNLLNLNTNSKVYTQFQTKRAQKPYPWA